MDREEILKMQVVMGDHPHTGAEIDCVCRNCGVFYKKYRGNLRNRTFCSVFCYKQYKHHNNRFSTDNRLKDIRDNFSMVG